MLLILVGSHIQQTLNKLFFAFCSRRNKLAGWWGPGIGTHPGWGGSCGGRCWGKYGDGGCGWGPSHPTAECILSWAA